jgi:hypothetical protein
VAAKIDVWLKIFLSLLQKNAHIQCILSYDLHFRAAQCARLVRSTDFFGEYRRAPVVNTGEIEETRV